MLQSKLKIFLGGWREAHHRAIRCKSAFPQTAARCGLSAPIPAAAHAQSPGHSKWPGNSAKASIIFGVICPGLTTFYVHAHKKRPPRFRSNHCHSPAFSHQATQSGQATPPLYHLKHFHYIQSMEEKIVEYSRFENLIEANLAKTKLDAYGIPCFLSDEHFGTLYPIANDGMPGIRLHIFERDKDRVKEILSDQEA